MNIRTILACTALLVTLTGCEELGIPDPAKDAERKQAEGEAIGSACRHAGRSLEDCYARNPKAVKAAIFTGWRNMNDYMTENQLEVVPPPPDPMPESHAPENADGHTPEAPHKDEHSQLSPSVRRHT